jgi:hypothetical protein
MSLDPQSMRRLEQLLTLMRLEVIVAPPDAEVVLRVRKRQGEVIGRDSRIERLITTRIDGAE